MLPTYEAFSRVLGVALLAVESEAAASLLAQHLFPARHVSFHVPVSVRLRVSSRPVSSSLHVSLFCLSRYSGYGGASGRPSVLNTFADAKAGYDELIRRGFRPDQIVLYGQSVGSGPACHLAARRRPRTRVHKVRRKSAPQRASRGGDPSLAAGASGGKASSPSLHDALAAVRAVVLHSPIASGIRALTAGGCCSPVNARFDRAGSELSFFRFC